MAYNKHYPLANQLLSQLTASDGSETAIHSLAMKWVFEWYSQLNATQPVGEGVISGAEAIEMNDKFIYLYHDLEALIIDLARYAYPAIRAERDDTPPAKTI